MISKATVTFFLEIFNEGGRILAKQPWSGLSLEQASHWEGNTYDKVDGFVKQMFSCEEGIAFIYF